MIIWTNVSQSILWIARVANTEYRKKKKKKNSDLYRREQAAGEDGSTEAMAVLNNNS